MATAVATAGGKTKRDVPYSWAGMDKKGNRVSGKSLAPDETALRADLRRQGIAVSKIKKQSTALKGGGKVNAGDIAVFSRQLATMLAAGIPLVQAFEIVGNGNEKPAMQKLILDIKADVEGGTSLHEALGRIIMEGGNAIDIADQAAKEGVWDLRRAGLEKVKAGVTSIEEVNSVTIE